MGLISPEAVTVLVLAAFSIRHFRRNQGTKSVGRAIALVTASVALVGCGAKSTNSPGTSFTGSPATGITSSSVSGATPTSTDATSTDTSATSTSGTTTSADSSSTNGSTKATAPSSVIASYVTSIAVGAAYMNAGTNAIAQVTLNGVAPTGGAKVTLTSSNASVISVPASVVVSAGAQSAVFAATAGNVTATSSATITAAYNNTFAGTTVPVKPSTTTTPPSTPPSNPTNGVSVTVSPANVTVAGNQSQQFTAQVSGSTNSNVSWTATAGTISASGLFVAPNVAATMSVTITATSQADTTAKSNAKVTVTPSATTTPPPPPTGGPNTYSGTGPVASWKAYQYKDTDGLYHQALLIYNSSGAYPVIGYSYASSACTNVGDTFNDFWQPLGNGLWWFIHDPELEHVKWVWYTSTTNQTILQQTPCIDYTGAPKYN